MFVRTLQSLPKLSCWNPMRAPFRSPMDGLGGYETMDDRGMLVENGDPQASKRQRIDPGPSTSAGWPTWDPRAAAPFAASAVARNLPDDARHRIWTVTVRRSLVRGLIGTVGTAPRAPTTWQSEGRAFGTRSRLSSGERAWPGLTSSSLRNVRKAPALVRRCNECFESGASRAAHTAYIVTVFACVLPSQRRNAGCDFVHKNRYCAAGRLFRNQGKQRRCPLPCRLTCRECFVGQIVFIIFLCAIVDENEWEWNPPVSWPQTQLRRFRPFYFHWQLHVFVYGCRAK